MLKKILFASFWLFNAVFLSLVTAFWFRETLVTKVANHLLAGRQVVVTGLHGLHFDSTHVAIEQLELQLPNGQQLLIAGVDARISVTSLFSVPVVETLELGCAELRDAFVPAMQNSGAAADKLPVSELTQLLREFPVAAIVVKAIRLPQRREALALALQHKAGELNLQINSDNLHLLANFTQASAATTAVIKITLNHNDETIGNFQLSLQPVASTFVLGGNGHLTIADLNTLSGDLQQQALKLPLIAVNLDFDLAGTVNDDVYGTFNGNATGTTPPTFALHIQSGSTIALPADPAGELGELTLRLSDKAELTFTTGAAAGINTATVPLQVTGSLQNKPFGIAAALTLSQTNVNGVYQLKTTGLEFTGLTAWQPEFDIDARLVLDRNQLSFSTPVLLRSAPADAGITSVGSYTFATGAASMHLSVAPVEFIEKSRPLSMWLGGWPYEFDLLTGTLTAELDVQLQAATQTTKALISANMKATLKDVAGLYNSIFFRGLNGEIKGSIDNKDTFKLATPPLTLTIASVDIGMPIDKLTVQFRLDKDSQHLLVSAAHGETLGGTVSAEDLIYDFSRERNDLKLRFSGVRLDHVLKMVKYDGIEASGAVSGILPLTLTSKGVEVAAGTLQADQPGGHIRYLAGAAAGVEGNASLALMNQALGNYQFESLTSSIDYAKNGELLLAVHLQGQNPDMNKGQRINLNLNLSDNIPALLKSLQATRVIEDFLQKKYQ